MEPNKIVSQEAWVAARKELLREEKEFTRLRDRLSQTAARFAVGARRQALCVPGANRQGDAAAALRGPQSACRLPLHVRPGRRDALQELLVLGGQLRRNVVHLSIAT